MAVAILVLVVTAVAEGLAVARGGQTAARQREVAAQIAQTAIEAARAAPFASLASSGPTPAASNANFLVTVTVTSIGYQLDQVQVQVTWPAAAPTTNNLLYSTVIFGGL